MQKIGLSIVLISVTGLVFANPLHSIFFDCKNIKQPFDKLGALTDYNNYNVVNVFKESNQIYRLYSSEPSDNRCPKSTCREWSSFSEDIVKLWFDSYLNPTKGYLQITHLNGAIDEYVCPVDA